MEWLCDSGFADDEGDRHLVQRAPGGDQREHHGHRAELGERRSELRAAHPVHLDGRRRLPFERIGQFTETYCHGPFTLTPREGPRNRRADRPAVVPVPSAATYPCSEVSRSVESRPLDGSTYIRGAPLRRLRWPSRRSPRPCGSSSRPSSRTRWRSSLAEAPRSTAAGASPTGSESS